MAGEIAGTVEILAELRERGVPLYALSNWSAETFPRAQARFPWLQWFRGIVISGADRKSTRLNSSHANISYAVFCLKKKKYNVSLSKNPRTSCILLARPLASDPNPGERRDIKQDDYPGNRHEHHRAHHTTCCP